MTSSSSIIKNIKGDTTKVLPKRFDGGTEEEISKPTLEAPVIETVPEEEVAAPKLSQDEIIVIAKEEATASLLSAANALQAAAEKLTQTKEEVVNKLEGLIPDLSILMTEKILEKEISTAPESILVMVRKALNLAIDSEEFRIELNPEDIGAVKEAQSSIISQISGLNSIILEGNDKIGRGGCIIESSICKVDASIEAQLEAFRESIGELKLDE